MNKILSIMLVAALATACGEKKAVAQTDKLTEQATQKPNILFILVDDLGYADLSVMGSEYYETPNIDVIAMSGTIFVNGYAACTVCSPSRASLMNGQFTARHGMTQYEGGKTGQTWKNLNRHTKLLPPEYRHFLNPDDITLPEILKDNGYSTFFAGKWHLGGEEQHSMPTDHGFDINIGGNESGGPNGGYFSPFKNPNLTNFEDEKGMPLAMKLAKETSKFITNNKDGRFFAYLSFYEVHAPIQTTKEKWTKYRNKAEKMGIHENGFAMERVLPARKHQDNPVYAGLIEQVDDAIGVVMKTLKTLNLDKNTIVVFTSDNGGVTSGDNFSTNALDLRGGKGYQWEGGVKVPYFIYVPWMQQGGNKIEEAVSGVDLYPTLLDLVNVPQNSKHIVDGVSLKPLLEKGSIAQRPLYWHYPHYGNQGGEPSSIIREGNHKLIYYWEDERVELYNLKTDVGETKDISKTEPKLTLQMKNKLLTWLKSMNTHYAEVDPLWNQAAWNKKLEDNKTKLMPRLEKDRKEILTPGWEPNKNWWGSDISK
ncbi:sulfatase [Flavobacterium algicola]|uniref:sulfatase n=1 Tax=Flavobacterium algicola TaxID=556529 RepID=UPI001EFDC597|nr:sulfatase [Flavobacterium algicola]MCG9792300.1 sulfatase [Flavobacterium algicola]